VATKKRRRPKGKNPRYTTGAVGLLKFMLFACLLAVILAGFAFLDRYVNKQSPKLSVNRTIEFVGDIPEWISEEIKNRVYAAATAEAGIKDIDNNAVAMLQHNIEQLVPWLDDVRVQTSHNSISIEGRWRKPIALVKFRKNKFFVDAESVILDYAELPGLSVVTVTGLGFYEQPPAPGDVWHSDDLTSALAILNRLERMDAVVSPDKPLLNEIDTIDVSNFNGRRNRLEPHIILYTKDDTKIIWGAEIGTWQRHLESPDDDKLAKLYTYYQQYGTLSGVKFINLRDPQQVIYLPVDRD